MGREQRKLFVGFFVNTPEQLKMAAWSVLCLLLGLGFQASIFLMMFQQRLEADMASPVDKSEIVYYLGFSFALVAVLGGILIGWVNIMYSHRIFGSIYVIKNAIQKLMNGEPVDPIKLRDTDQVSELAETVNKLIQVYPKK